MKRLYSLFPLPGLLLAGIGIAAPLWAQQQPPQEEEGPGRGVARLSLMNGDVSVQRGDSGDWVAGALNAPLLAEDRIATGPTSRAEVQFDYHHRVRIAPDSEAKLAELEQRQYLLQVARGTVTFTALPGGDAQVEISTPGAAVRPVAHGNYRVTVLPDGSAEITVRSGEAEIFTPRGSQRLRPGRTMLVRPDANGGPEFTLVSAIGRDAWDEFNEARDRDLRRGESVYRSYVSRDIYGAEDLHGHGNWVHVPPYGMVWRPFVAAGWAPYTMGRWVWLDWYGWSWVSHDPWGWAPYHYGRWFMHAGNWCWFPGAYGGRHFWRPGLVGWIGFGGPNWGVGLGFGRVGWVPLAPFEPFHPWWGRGMYRGYRGGNFVQNNITIVNNTNVTNVYRNARIGNAVNIVNGDDFRRGFHGRVSRASADDLRSANLVRGAVPVGPERSSLRFSDREANMSTATRAANGQERFYTRREVARVDRVPFEQQRSAFTGGARGAEGPAGFAGRAAGSERGTTESADAGRGWRRFGDPGNSAARGGESRSGETRQGFTGGERTNVLPSRSTGEMRGVESRSTSGWRRFGDPEQGTRTETTGAAERSGFASRSRNESATEPARTTGGGGWSTGRSRNESTAAPTTGGERGGFTGRSRNESATEPARTTGGGGWSTGRSRNESTAAPTTGGERGGFTGRSRNESAAEPARTTGGGGWSTGGTRDRSTTSAPAATTSPSRGGWSTGGSRNETPRTEAPRSTPPDRGAWSTGGGRSEAPRATTGGGTTSSSRSGGGWSTGSSRSEAPRGVSGGFNPGSSGRVSGGMRSAPSGGSFGGGSVRSAPSRGSFGGGGMRSAPSGGGFGVGGVRSAPSGGGGRSGGSAGGRVRGGRNE
ncbi:MAG: FecR domain-containing protein [Bryobacteraceae bacterium]|nr:FecR domain-containing protein [Bryobacteraceae bacterium]